MSIERVAALAAGLTLVLTQLLPAQILPAHGGTTTTAGPGPASYGASLDWQLTPTGSQSRFRGLAAVSDRVAWLGGSAGQVLRTTDGGAHWQNVSPPGAAGLAFRDVEAFDANRAVVLSIGSGEASRIFRTSDGGRTWTETFRNTDPDAFYDCFAFFDGHSFDHRHGLALSDPVGGKFRILSTSDGGRRWKVLPNAGMPPALPQEFAFAASGTCLVSGPGRTAWFATGQGERARVFRTTDGGRTWRVADSPVASTAGGTAGIYSLAFPASGRIGVAVGGDFQAPEQAVKAAAFSRDGGRSWRLVPADKAPDGYRSGSAFVPGRPFTVIAVGETGSDVSFDGGATWRKFDDGSFDGVQCVPRACWASGEQGRAARLTR